MTPARPRLLVSALLALALAAGAAGCTDDPTPQREAAADEEQGPALNDPTEAWGDRSPTGWGPTKGELAHATHLVSEMSNRQVVGQLFVADFSGTRAPLELVRRFDLGGVIIGSANGSDPGDLSRLIARLQADSRRSWPLVVSVDQEGGTVSRIGPPFTAFPTFMSFGAARQPALAGQVSESAGRQLRALGFTMVYAPDADVTVGAADPTIRSRSAGSSPGLVSAIVRASLAGYGRSGIVAVLKHFPGHGSVTANSHHALPHQGAPTKALESHDFMPFAAGIAAHAPAVMMGHISLDRLDRGVPADLSPAAIRLLRDDLGFSGLITTDALNMAAVTRQAGPAVAAVRALLAGVDMLLMPKSLPQAYRGVLDALASGRLSRERLEASAAKIGALMLHEAALPDPPRRVVGSHRALSRRLSEQALTVVTGRCRGPYVGASVRPVGEGYLVSAFRHAAARAGLPVTSRGTTVALMGEDAPRKRVDVAVSVSAPYVLADAKAATRLALFGWTPGAMDALVSALTGTSPPHGRLPVPVAGFATDRCGAGPV